MGEGGDNSGIQFWGEIFQSSWLQCAMTWHVMDGQADYIIYVDYHLLIYLPWALVKNLVCGDIWMLTLLLPITDIEKKTGTVSFQCTLFSCIYGLAELKNEQGVCNTLSHNLCGTASTVLLLWFLNQSGVGCFWTNKQCVKYRFSFWYFSSLFLWDSYPSNVMMPIFISTVVYG